MGAHVRGDTAALEQTLDRGGAHPHVHVVTDQLMRDAVVVPVGFHVVVDADLGF